MKRPFRPAVAVNVLPVTARAVIVPGSGTGEPGAGPPTRTNVPRTVCRSPRLPPQPARMNVVTASTAIVFDLT